MTRLLPACVDARSEHFLCEEPECEGCFTAFATQEELAQHRRERHSQRMPRWDPRAPTRQLQVRRTAGTLLTWSLYASMWSSV